jgi:sorbitol-specific phosphotransferase system component IIA
MTPILALSKDVPDAFGDNLVVCFYTNVTHNIQVLRLNHFECSTWERIIFPGERLMFEAQPQCKLEIKTSEAGTLLLSCQQLRVS